MPQATTPHTPLHHLVLMFMAGITLANGALMILFTEQWYLCLINPARASLFNAHFVTDVGTAYLAIGAALLWATLRPAYAYPLVMIALLFSSLHVVHHLYEYGSFGIPTRHAIIEALGIWGPAVVLGWLGWRLRPSTA